MGNCKISVIITIYNMEQYLDKCIQSVINQTYKNLEIILVNDGSTDNSHNICKKYAIFDNRVVVVNKNNEGLVKQEYLALSRLQEIILHLLMQMIGWMAMHMNVLWPCLIMKM